MLHLLEKFGFDYSEEGGSVLETVKELARLKGLKLDFPCAPKVAVLSLSAGVTDILVEEFNAKETPWIYRARPLYIGRIGRIEVAIIWAAPGAPLAAMVSEHLIACGAEYIIGIGLLASIQPAVDIGSIILPLEAIRGEGTSYYYIPPNEKATADRELANTLREACKKLGVKCVEGTIYTTDAIHRETPKLINALQGMGVIGIDMETSAVYAVAKRRKAKAACILVASTSPKTKSIGFYSEALRKHLKQAAKIAKTAISIQIKST